MRINKFIASSTNISRRKADDLIKDKKVIVNNELLEEPGYDVKPGDTVVIDGKVLSPEKEKLYYLLNKPIGYVTTTNDEFNRPKVIDLIDDEKRLFPVGRLDYNTSGAIIITNDGDFANKIMHPSKKIDKTYKVLINGIPTRYDIKKLEKGIKLKEFTTAPSKVEIIKCGKQTAELFITIHEGHNRQVRRMFEVLGYKVIELQRVSIGSLRINRLGVGKYRKLSKKEIEQFL